MDKPLEGRTVVVTRAASQAPELTGALESYGAKAGEPLFDIIPDPTPLELVEARRWVDAGWATLRGTVLRLTPEGWLRLDALAAALT